MKDRAEGCLCRWDVCVERHQTQDPTGWFSREEAGWRGRKPSDFLPLSFSLCKDYFLNVILKRITKHKGTHSAFILHKVDKVKKNLFDDMYYSSHMHTHVWYHFQSCISFLGDLLGKLLSKLILFENHIPICNKAVSASLWGYWNQC